jgi:type I restriction enzyme S subunit
MAQAIFRYWFIERMSQSYDYQSDLIFRSLFDFANYINGTSFKKDEYSDTGIPIIKIAELKNGITNSTQRFSGEKDEKYYIKNKDILLNQHTFIVKTNDGTPWFVYHLLKHFKKEFSHIASNKQTTGLGHVTVSDLRRLQFPYDLELMKAFEQIVSPIMETYYRNLCENQQLAFLRDSLLPKLMSGELSVSDIQAAK